MAFEVNRPRSERIEKNFFLSKGFVRMFGRANKVKFKGLFNPLEMIIHADCPPKNNIPG
jgi:hypothetical protein